MKAAIVILGVFASLLLVSSQALAGLDVETKVSCPAQATAGTTITMDVHLESLECSATIVRLISSIAGNVDDTAGGVGVFGPVVADPGIAVPAAPSGCPSPLVPAVVDTMVTTPPALPVSLVGTVATYIVVAEWDGGKTTRVAECMVEVLSP